MTHTPTRLRVLILEDNPDDADLLVRELRRANFDPDWKLVDTEQAYLAHLEPNIDVILSDYFLPGFSGLRALRLLHERGLEIPFIIVSGRAGEEAAVAAMQEGAADYLLKDRLGRLGSAIMRVLEKKQIDRALHNAEKQLANILEHAAESIIAVNQDSQIIVFNKAAEKTFGYSAQEALGRPLDLLIPDRLVKAHRQHVRKFAAQPEPYRQIEHRQGLLARRKDGSEFPVEIGLSRVETDHGTIFTAMIVDISERKRSEAALTQTINLLSRAEQIGHIGSWAWDIAENRAVWSDGMYRIFGLTPQEFGATYEAYLERVHPEDREHVRQLIESAYHDHASFEYENRIVRPDGEIRIEYSRGEVILNEKGEPARLLGVGIDITERKQAEELLHQTQERAETILASVNDSYILFDREWHYLYVNEAGQNAIAASNPVGAPKEQILGRTLWEIFPDILGTDLEHQYRYAMEQRLPTRFEFHYLLRNTWWENRFYPIPEGLAVFGTDITERKRAEEKISQHLERLTALREIDQAITSTFDVRMSLNVVLSHATKLLAVDAAAVLLLDPVRSALEYTAGKGFRTDVIKGTSVKLGASLAGRVARERRIVQIPALVHQPSDLLLAHFLEEEKFVSYYGAPLIVKGRVLGVLEVYSRSLIGSSPDWLDFFSTLAGQAAIAIDNAQLFENLQRSNVKLEQHVAERTAELNRINQELEHASRAKDEFLANMSHELRTPLNSILGMSESLLEQRRDQLSERQQKSLRIIESSGTHLLGLINDILDLSKIDAGKFDVFPQIIEVDSLCRSSLNLVSSQAAKKSILLRYEADEDVPRINADPRRLKQILVNLLTNAVKFTPQGGQVTLQVQGDAEQDRVQFSVIDTGIGIAPQDIKRLFQPFTQLDAGLNRHQEGTGLGLVLVQRLTDLHGGSIQVESEPGLGSQFTINLPWGRATLLKQESQQGDQTQTTKEVPITPPTTEQPRGTILLAEDNMANVLTIAEYLEGHGYEVRAAHDGLEAIQMAGSMNPDIILMDIHMPAMDGLEAIRRLRAEPRFASTPIIALTALAMPGDRERCIEAGANEYMSKPVSLKKLRSIINEMLEKGR